MTDFEKYARQELNQYESPVDTERLWGAVEQAIQPGQRRPKALWFWWIGLGLLLGTGAAGYWWAVRNTPATPAGEKIEMEKTSPVAGVSPNGLPSAGSAAPSSPLVSPNPSPSPTGKGAVAYTATPPLTKNSGDGHGAGTPASLSVGRNAANSSKGTVTHTARPPFTENGGDGPEAGTTAIGPVEGNPTTGPFSAAARRGAEAYTAPLPLRGNRLEDIAVHTTAPFPVGEGLGLTQGPAFHPSDQTGCSKWGKKSAFRPYFGVYGGALYPLKSLKDKTTEFEYLVNARRATETVLEGVTAGGYLGLQHWNGLSLEAGLEYQRMNERFDQTTVIKDTIGQIAVTGIIVNAPGDTTFIQDSIFVTQETRTVKQTYNNYRFLQLPLAIGYTWKTDGPWSPYVKIGAAINLRFGQKAEIISPDGTSEKYVSEDAGRADYPFRTRIGLSPFVQAGLRYRLGAHLSLFGELRYVHPGSGISAAAYPVEQRYRLPGANVGMHWGF